MQDRMYINARMHICLNLLLTLQRVRQRIATITVHHDAAPTCTQVAAADADATIFTSAHIVRNKKNSEQNAALVACMHLGLLPTDTPADTPTARLAN